MICTVEHKYIRWRTRSLAFEPARESLYDLRKDPDELTDVVGLAEYDAILQWCRDRLAYVINATPAGQTSWAPLFS